MLTGLLLLVTSKLLLLFLSTWKRRCFKTNNRALAAVKLCPYPAISTRLFQQCRQNCTRYSSRFHCAVQCSTCTAVECSAVQFSVQYSAPESYSLERGGLEQRFLKGFSETSWQCTGTSSTCQESFSTYWAGRHMIRSHLAFMLLRFHLLSQPLLFWNRSCGGWFHRWRLLRLLQLFVYFKTTLLPPENKINKKNLSRR